MEEINKILSEFNSVSLSQIEEVKLMNRIDRKYWFHISDLSEILSGSKSDYDILEINGQRLMDYETTYFDTPDNQMYLFHHNRKLNRIKIRKRRYYSTNKDFLEIKLKNNKQRTIKERIEVKKPEYGFSDHEVKFIEANSMYSGKNLNPTLNNKFQRITLINKKKTDRCTIDLNLKFTNHSGKIILDDLAIVEIKRSQNLKSSPLLVFMREKKIRQRGLSKYCTGRAILEPGLKQNAFKPRLRFINKNITLYTN
ncbi:MAG: polyphosphate polymerase domain-containing protein [Prolixibacteraceae bacterium]|nr:polyphosphate polymerase domain-containing protein [Prolixibacteraceae bacterium]MBN2774938.1 polyphosphate polymerase domain-containing protein [Prolixibacteraceae bacterium]